MGGGICSPSIIGPRFVSNWAAFPLCKYVCHAGGLTYPLIDRLRIYDELFKYQILAGVIEQRILEPLLHKHKLALSAICFVVRTGNTFLGSLMWVDFARWTGIQRTRE